MKKTKNKNSVQISDNLIEFLNQPDGEIQIPEKFSEKVLYWSEKIAGGAVFNSLCEVRKLINKLPTDKQEEFNKHLNIISSALHYELNEYKKLHSTKSKRESAAEPMYSIEYRENAINIFNTLDVQMSKNSRAKCTLNKLEDPDSNSRAKVKPSEKTILNWIKSAK